MISNQKIERHYFELFRKIYQLPDGEIKFGDKPDVIINGDKRVDIFATITRVKVPDDGFTVPALPGFLLSKNDLKGLMVGSAHPTRLMQELEDQLV
ncbi:MAG: hypothetical protein ACLPT6_01085 [Desulfobaccales bacterium]